MTLKERINTLLLEIDSPAGFKMVYKSELMKIVEEYEKEVEDRVSEALHEFPPVYHSGPGVTSTELGYLDGITSEMCKAIKKQLDNGDNR